MELTDSLPEELVVVVTVLRNMMVALIDRINR